MLKVYYTELSNTSILVSDTKSFKSGIIYTSLQEVKQWLELLSIQFQEERQLIFVSALNNNKIQLAINKINSL